MMILSSPTTSKDLGYFNYDDITTYYGEHTVNAVKNFQTVGLEADGILDPLHMKHCKLNYIKLNLQM